MPHQKILTSWSIRGKLLLLLLVIFLPVSGIIVASGLDHRRHEIEEATDSAAMLAQSLAGRQQQITMGTKQMLSTLAQLPEVRKLDAHACSELFRAVHMQHPYYAAIGATTPDGNMFAASWPFQPGNINLSDRKHVKEVIETLDFSVGEYIMARVRKVPSINYAYPVLDENRKLLAIVIAGFKLDEYSHFITKVHVPEGYTITITDHAGVQLYHLPDYRATASSTPVIEESFKWITSDLKQETFEKTGADNIERVYAFKRLRLRESSSPYLYVIVSIPKDEILDKANLQMLSNLLILGIVALIAMVSAWGFGNFVFIRPIKHLVAAAQRFGEGEMGARTGLVHTPDELGQLAESFDHMASLLEIKVAERTAELAAANETLKLEIVERKRTESELLKAQARLSELLSHSPAAIYSCTPSQDFTERREMEESLRAALIRAEDEKSKAESIIATLSDGLTIQDRDLKIVYQNENFTKNMGSHVGEYCYRAFHQRDRICDDCHIARCFEDGATYRKEKSLNIDGRTMHVEIATSPLRNASGEVVAAIELVRAGQSHDFYFPNRSLAR